MPVWALGLNHNTAPLDLRGRFAYALDQVEPTLRGLRASLARQSEAALLSTCYRSSLSLAAEHEAATVAFPSITTGIYGYPVDRACRIALREIARGLERHPGLTSVTVVCFDEATLGAYREAEQELAAT